MILLLAIMRKVAEWGLEILVEKDFFLSFFVFY